MENCRKDVERLTSLRCEENGILEDIFNGAYGSDLEEKLELESEQLLQYKQHLGLAHYKWWNCRQLVHHACTQMAYACRRWTQIQEINVHDNQVSIYSFFLFTFKC